jgi:alkanesulfonate monooxygenase SsuD/methylene tetrahydromethanopterin reductase-like flavin-dependent oxidoreductase (luciferase family)
MRYGIFVPLVGEFVEPSSAVGMAQAAEAAGWDALFVSDLNESGSEAPETDPCITLAAIASTTTTLRVGLVTPVADRRRPWVLARQSAVVDRLSQGRLTFATGVGYASWHKDVSLPGGAPLDEGEEAMTFLFEESLAVLLMCWSGEPVRHDGIWLHVDSPPLLVTPLQRPRIPVWLSARWPSRNPLRRAAHLDGIFPVFDERSGLRAPPEPHQVRSIRANLEQLGTGPDYDVALRGVLGPRWTEESLHRLGELEDAGATWWFETVEAEESASSALERVAAGPPQPS